MLYHIYPSTIRTNALKKKNIFLFVFYSKIEL